MTTKELLLNAPIRDGARRLTKDIEDAILKDLEELENYKNKTYVFFYLKVDDRYVHMLSNGTYNLVTIGSKTATRFREDDLSFINNLKEFEIEKGVSKARIKRKIMRTSSRRENGITLKYYKRPPLYC